MPTRIWLTLKQHRFETVAVIGMCLVVAAGALIEAWRLNSVDFPHSCLQDGNVPWFDPSAPPTACSIASQRFHDIADGMDVRLLLHSGQLLPFIVGIAIGAPLVAKEIDQGTAPLSWALAGSRTSWLLGKVLAAVLVIVPLLLIAGLGVDALQAALVPGVDPHASFDSYTARGVILVFWGLAALSGSVALGALMGRALPAVLVALVVCFLARGFWEPVLNRTVLPPLAVQGDPNSWNPNDLSVYYRWYLDGKPWDGDIIQWWNEHQPPMQVDPSGVAVITGANPPTFDPSTAPQSVPFVITGERYWPIVALESGILLAGSIFCGAVAFFWVGRRKPY